MSEEVTVRRATAADARAFHAFWSEIVAEERYVRSEEVRVPVRAYRRRFRVASAWEVHLLAFRGDRLVGYITLQRDRHPVTRHVASLAIAVAADERGRGIGRRLMSRGIEWARDVGVEKLVLSVYPNNEAAIALYRSFGFVQEGRLARHSRKSYGYEDEILMATWIGDA